MVKSGAKVGKLLGCYRVLEVADEKGEYCGKLMADLGADVVKVENPHGGETRLKGPFFHDQISLEKSLNFLHFNTNKRSITLNLENRDGQMFFKELVKQADAVVESMPVGYLGSLGLDYKSLATVNPGLVMTSITPFGQTGPHKDYNTTDIVNMAMGGFIQVCGEPDGPPLRPGGEQSYHIGSQFAALATVAALYHRAQTGEGQYIDISLQECIYTYQTELAGPQSWAVHKIDVARSGSRPRHAFPYGLFECKDGWAVVACIAGTEWDRLAEWIHEITGDSEVLDEMYKGTLFDRAPYVDILTHILLDFTKRFDKDELFLEGQKRRIPIMPVHSVQEVMNCPHLNEWRFFRQVKHPVVGELKHIGSPYQFSEENLSVWQPAPLLGEHNEEIYCSEIGLSKEDLTILRSNGVI